MHIALVCPNLHGHMNPMATLGQEMLRRGHRVSMFGTMGMKPKADYCGFNFVPVGLPEHQSGAAQAEIDTVAKLKGLAALQFTAQMLTRASEILLRDALDQFRFQEVDGVLVDQLSPAGAAIADVLKLPYVLVCNALAVHQETAIPPAILPWKYRPGFIYKLRNGLGNTVLKFAAGPISKMITKFRLRNGLSKYDFNDSRRLGLAQIAQQPEFFDFPRSELPTHFHYTGPWHSPSRDTESVEFPWGKLDGRPLIYASLGTMQNQLQALFRAILDGCSTLKVQIVLSLGKKGATWNEPTPENAIVVPFAPQLTLLERADLLITHAGLNTALEGLGKGLPMLCIPITNDQPGVARRVEWLGAGVVVSPGRITAESVRSAVEKLMTGESYRDSARKCRDLLKMNLGVVRAADIVEECLTTKERLESKRG